MLSLFCFTVSSQCYFSVFLKSCKYFLLIKYACSIYNMQLYNINVSFEAQQNTCYLYYQKLKTRTSPIALKLSMCSPWTPILVSTHQNWSFIVSLILEVILLHNYVTLNTILLGSVSFWNLKMNSLLFKTYLGRIFFDPG